jgi:hypothetical protein
VIAISVLLLVIAVVAFLNVYNRDNWERAHRVHIPTFTYQVEGTANSVSIKYSGHDGDGVEAKRVSLPWTMDLTFDKTVLFASVWAMSFESGGTLTCRIFEGWQAGV